MEISTAFQLFYMLSLGLLIITSIIAHAISRKIETVVLMQGLVTIVLIALLQIFTLFLGVCQ